jgi:hypothetical protein
MIPFEQSDLLISYSDCGWKKDLEAAARTEEATRELESLTKLKGAVLDTWEYETKIGDFKQPACSVLEILRKGAHRQGG